ncbi:MAG: FAD-dependent oxidoreductase [Thalassococcus sp.]|uniref:FAD-dependent oxidoreductase n=1 Tax=Thalassococcus sp. TaxID=1928858 RepID=UPI001B19121F|nr:FAD-dependent oxidoreductase [Thalassococcus sp.]MBO6866094.1 FAD-dependent oxidoreductase [Thalassococcus sp.]
MELDSVLVIGGGIGGLTAAIALRRKGFAVEIVEKDPEWSVYGVGIIQQFNVIRAMASLDLLDAYMEKAYGFDRTVLFAGPAGQQVADFNTPRLAGEDHPSNAGIRRRDLQKVLADRAQALGVTIRLGTTVETITDDGAGVTVALSDGTTGRHDIVIGADGVFSRTRGMILPDAPNARYTGQWVWRYNLPQPPEMEGIQIFSGPVNAGFVPLGAGQMYMFLLSEEPDGMTLPLEGSAEAMRDRIGPLAPPQVKAVADQITQNADVVARPLEVVFVDSDWHKGRVVLLGDAIHASTPHLAQGAGMAIEDGIVLAEELTRHDTPEAAFTAYRNRRFERAKFIADNSVLIGDSQMGKVPPVDVGALNGRTIGLMAEPI